MSDEKHEQTSQYWQQVLALGGDAISVVTVIPGRDDWTSGFEVMP